MRPARIAQLVGVVMAGVGIGMNYGLHDPSGFRWAVAGIAIYAVARLWPWLRGKD